jgi:hypothetical protein
VACTLAKIGAQMFTANYPETEEFYHTIKNNFCT